MAHARSETTAAAGSTSTSTNTTSPLLADLGHGNRPGKRPAARGTAFYPRKRANTACQVCRARKTKCDNKKPSCSYCVSVGANCIQSPVDLSSFDPASLKILDRLDELERILLQPRPSPTESAATTSIAQGLGAIGDDIDDHEEMPAAAATTSSSSGKPAEEHQTLPAVGSGSGSGGVGHGSDRSPGVTRGGGYHREFDDVPLRSMLPERVETILRWPCFSDGSLPMTTDMANAASPTSSVTTPVNPHGSLAELAEMDQQSVNTLLDKFFIGIHGKNPILDEASARRTVRRAFAEGIDWSPGSCLALIICALGCLATPFGPSHSVGPGTRAYTDSQVFFHAAQRRIGVLLARSDIIGAQCLFLSGVYMMSTFQPIFAWRFFSQALAACQHVPFLRRAQYLSSSSPATTPSSASGFSPEGMDMCRRDTQEQAVYWSAWKSERELRRELSLPDFGGTDGGGVDNESLYPPFFPTPPQPSAAITSPGAAPDPQDQRARAAWLFYLAEISLRRLNGRLCGEIQILRRDNPRVPRFLEALAEMIPEYEMQAREWAASLPAELSISGGNGMGDEDICRSVLRGHLANLFETVYWPFAVAGLDAIASGRPTSAATREMLGRALSEHVDRLEANEPGFLHRHHGALFMIKSCTRSALVLVAAANLVPAADMPPRWSLVVYKVIGMLAYWSGEVPELGNWKRLLELQMTKANAITS